MKKLHNQIICGLFIFCIGIDIGNGKAVIAPKEWDVLGPFPRGMREIGDPLTAFGGIFQIDPNSNSSFPSEMGIAGRIYWEKVSSQNDGSVFITYQKLYDSSFLSGPFGWAIMLWQGWAVGTYQISEEGRYIIQCFGTHVVYLNNSMLSIPGDWYNYGYLKSSVYLSAGKLTLYVKLESSVRAFGNTPNITFNIIISRAPSSNIVPIVGSAAIIPDMVNNKFTSSLFAVPVLNSHTTKFTTVSVSSKVSGININSSKLTLAPGQTSLLIFETSTDLTCPNFDVEIRSDLGDIVNVSLGQTFSCFKFGSTPYKFTFRDYDGSIQYALALPPKYPCYQSPQGKCSLMVAMHGAGVEASNQFWTQAFIQQKYTWILFPTGRRPWGFDWHGPSVKNVLSAIQTLTSSLPGVPTSMISSYSIDPKRILFTGHSMGGAGCWFISTHFPDLAIASAPVAGFISLEKYVPFFLHLGNSHMDTYLRSILQASFVEFDSDLYAPNLIGVPLLPRYGSDDTNVPPWNTRRNSRIINEFYHNPNAVLPSEVPGEQHWWDTAMNGSIIQKFYEEHLERNLPNFPQEFEVVAINPDSFDGRGSIKFLQFEIPRKMAKIYVKRNSIWELETVNLLRFGFIRDSRGPKDSVIVDGQAFPLNFLPNFHYCLSDNKWAICKNDDWKANERTLGEHGPVASIFERKFHIVYPTQGSSTETEYIFKLATNLANNWFLYGNGNTSLVQDKQATLEPNTSYILLGGPSINSFSYELSRYFPVKYGIDDSFVIGRKEYKKKDLGLQFLSSLPNKQLAVVISGTSLSGFTDAYNRFPLFTGMSVPDFLVTDSQNNWKGDAGTLAAGYWGNFWEYSPHSSYQS